MPPQLALTVGIAPLRPVPGHHWAEQVDESKSLTACEQLARLMLGVRIMRKGAVCRRVRRLGTLRSLILTALLLIAPALVLTGGAVRGAEYWVDQGVAAASDTNLGTASAPWLTIGYAASKASAGDVVRVRAGTYNERVAIRVSGTSGAWINYVAMGQVICRGFDMYGLSYVRLVGFEITHTNTAYAHGVVLYNTCSRIDLIDNYIHEVNGNGLRVDFSTGKASYITVRGNRFYYMGCVPGVVSNESVTAIGNVYVTPHHWLAEYNVVQRSADIFICIYGTNNIARNNYCWDFKDVYWNGNGSVHSDIFQDGSDGTAVGSRHHVYERNFCGDCTETNSHFGIWQDTVSAGDTNMLIRGNVGYSFGSGGVGVLSSHKVATYNNTFYDINSVARSGAVFSYYKDSTSTNYPLYGLVANAIIHTSGDLTTDPIYIQPGSTGTTATHNLGYSTHSSPSFVSTSDPLFIDPTSPARNFRLQPGSPAIGAGTNVAWITSASGSGTNFTVNDGLLFIDGWGMVDGDTITVGGTTTRITSIVGNSVKVANPVTWTNRAPVYWGTDTNKTIGAFPYGSSQLTSAALIQSGVTNTVITTGDARGVWFYVDGVPKTWVPAPPYTANFTNGTVTAKAYALYAQASPVVVATNGAATAPAAPSGLRIGP